MPFEYGSIMMYPARKHLFLNLKINKLYIYITDLSRVEDPVLVPHDDHYLSSMAAVSLLVMGLPHLQCSLVSLTDES